MNNATSKCYSLFHYIFKPNICNIFLPHNNLLERDAVLSGRQLPTFQRNLLPPSSGYKYKSSAQKNWYEYKRKEGGALNEPIGRTLISVHLFLPSLPIL
jgi:hypothetical protein